jgi:hypothetical protein
VGPGSLVETAVAPDTEAEGHSAEDLLIAGSEGMARTRLDLDGDAHMLPDEPDTGFSRWRCRVAWRVTY